MVRSRLVVAVVVLGLGIGAFGALAQEPEAARGRDEAGASTVSLLQEGWSLLVRMWQAAGLGEATLEEPLSPPQPPDDGGCTIDPLGGCE